MCERAFDPFPVIGILGGGQLGRMMAIAAIPMGLNVRFLAPAASGPMRGLGEQSVGDWENESVLRSWAEGLSVITVESEWAPADAAAKAVGNVIPVWPSHKTIDLIRHKGRQKTHLVDAGLPVPAFRNCASLNDAHAAAREFGYPILLKQYMRSYDGYGNATVGSERELTRAWNDLAAEDGLMVEAFVSFEQELSVLVARRPGGQHVIYPVAYTEQRDHRCHAVISPAEGDPGVLSEARRVGLAAVESVDAVGLTAVELFQMPDGRVLINELAPRPHNTGHYSIEGCYTSQFENHVRAILDLPLGNPELREPVSVMVNVLGRRNGVTSRAGFREALDIPGVAVHLYGKPEVRRQRKMGHVTVCGHRREDVRRRAENAAAMIEL